MCIFAYGQTGAGKTYTMEGGADGKGVNYQALHHIFSTVERERKTSLENKYTVQLSVVEIYLETVRDLLNPAGAKQVDVRQGGDSVYIPDLTEVVVNNTAEVRELMLKQAGPNRSVRGTSMNEHSSRSHCLLMVNVVKKNVLKGTSTTGKLVLIDLAGSERLKKSEAKGQGMKEAQAINKSLAALGNVINALQNKSSHVPYRDSKLTFLLQNSLGGSCKCLMFCQVSPASDNYQETSCSLQFASRVRATKLGTAKKNTGADVTAIKQKAQKDAAKQQQKSQQKISDQLLSTQKALEKKDEKVGTRCTALCGCVLSFFRSVFFVVALFLSE